MDTHSTRATKNQLLDTAQAAHYLGKAQVTLEAWRYEGKGPTYYRVGRRIHYKEADLDAFIEAGRVEAVQ